MSDHHIQYEPSEGIGRLRLNRPEKRNALTAAMIVGLQEALRASAADPAVRVVLLTGEGPDFCSGADLGGVLDQLDAGPVANLDDARQLAQVFLAMRRHPRPIVAAVQGRALAGGCGLASAADVVLAAEDAHFGYPEINVGFVPAMVAAILRRCVPEKRALELLITGEVISAPMAASLGLVNRVIAAAAFAEEVEAYVASIARKPADAVYLTKALLYATEGSSFEAALEAGVQTNVLARMTPDFRAGVERFLKKSKVGNRNA